MNWVKSKYTSFEYLRYILHLPVFIFFVLVPYFSLAQDTVRSTIKVNTSLPVNKNGYRIYPHNKKRIHVIAAGNIAGYGATLVGFNSAWYSKHPKSNFHFFNDNAEWLQVDKAGHLYGAYIGSSASNELWRWTGLPRKQRIWISGLSGIAYEGIIETLDGFSSQYGWSWGDFTANVLGSTLF
ncbi:MAG: DUF2279 domain-containing protein, partial [Chitinophagaceae bacterium]|nr:DUF2279 domain-containing protein [Chitinophagaceae bacterium]